MPPKPLTILKFPARLRQAFCAEIWLWSFRLFIRLVLIAAVVHFLPTGSLFTARAQEPLMEDAGVGGGAYPQSETPGIFQEEEAPEGDPVLDGIPEPELFSKPHVLLSESYRVQRGDIIGDLARKFGLNQDTLISYNAIKNTRLLQIGQILKIPNQDGILHTVSRGDTLNSLAETHKTSPEDIKLVNELFSDFIREGTTLFIPGARLDWVNLQEINGDLFTWPLSGRITSSYGYRADPFTGVGRQFHSGIDIGAVSGTPIRAAMSGRVIVAGWNDVYGNYVVVNHHSGYRTLYAHMSLIRVKTGEYVSTGQRLGDVGSTGRSTAPHLHFTVYKNGVTVNPRTLMK
ncbi:MAG: M23 family metallopeptidase [Treponema sp.]|jgi:murein DD-endopeptidase MepM/ murein hydrolase activator NlpD|nr:M23 family metallopeptidase [Treponema sp.]